MKTYNTPPCSRERFQYTLQPDCAFLLYRALIFFLPESSWPSRLLPTQSQPRQTAVCARPPRTRILVEDLRSPLSRPRKRTLEVLFRFPRFPSASKSQKTLHLPHGRPSNRHATLFWLNSRIVFRP